MSESAHSELPFTRESQTAAILRAFQRGEKLTGLGILNQFQCISAKQRIWDLREAGWNIKDEWLTLPNQKRIKRWYLDLTDPHIKRTNGHKKPSLRDLAKLYIESLPESEKLKYSTCVV